MWEKLTRKIIDDNEFLLCAFIFIGFHFLKAQSEIKNKSPKISAKIHKLLCQTLYKCY
jgi:hypothetical protein